MSTEDDNAPLWSYVTKLDQAAKGGNKSWRCNFCQDKFTGSHYRVKAHLLKISNAGVAKCRKVTQQNLAEMQRVVEEAELRLKNAKPRDVPLPSITSRVGGSSSGSASISNMGGSSSSYMDDDMTKKRKGMPGPLEKSYNLAAREELHGEIARMFYTGGLSFHLARNPHFIRSYALAASKTIPGYLPPGYNLLRTTLLQKEKANIERLLEPTKKAWEDKGVTICSDGWSDAQRRPLINIMAVCESGPMFLSAKNCEGEYKDKFFIANLLNTAIHDVGPQNVVQVITDNAAACKAAGHLVEQKFPHIFWTPCVVHTLNLALKNICSPKAKNREAFEQCSWIAEISNDALFIKNYIVNHGMRLHMFNVNVKLKLLTIADTRFASVLVMLKRLKDIKQGLQQMVISDPWDLYKQDDVDKAKIVKERILDEVFWSNVEYILSFTSPIYEMLRMADTDKPCLHLVYEWWDSMIEKVKQAIHQKERIENDNESSFFRVVHGVLVARWNKSNTPLHCLAHSLNPRYYSKEWLHEAPNRLAPHKDPEISKERQACLERYFPIALERRNVNEEYASFSACIEDFSGNDSMRDRGLMPPVKWWVIHGASTPTLQTLAFKLLGQPCSSSCCERNWATYNFIHSFTRNKMTPQRAEDLVYVHYNLRLLSRKSTSYNEAETKMWDVAGNAFDTMSMENGGMLEIANLSLDEPELEAMLFVDDVV